MRNEDKLQCDASAPAVRGASRESKLGQTSTAACATKNTDGHSHLEEFLENTRCCLIRVNIWHGRGPEDAGRAGHDEERVADLSHSIDDVKIISRAIC